MLEVPTVLIDRAITRQGDICLVDIAALGAALAASTEFDPRRFIANPHPVGQAAAQLPRQAMSQMGGQKRKAASQSANNKQQPPKKQAKQGQGQGQSKAERKKAKLLEYRARKAREHREAQQQQGNTGGAEDPSEENSEDLVPKQPVTPVKPVQTKVAKSAPPLEDGQICTTPRPQPKEKRSVRTVFNEADEAIEVDPKKAKSTKEKAAGKPKKTKDAAVGKPKKRQTKEPEFDFDSPFLNAAAAAANVPATTR